ncbi:patatin-like phospholipase family protein [Pseudofrankia sp. DC12]|uniref:patatin-like phospholipase family protein n=1 Tax=Pseudofrankia sp. DC12 TaxID=683315 RepID=UPI0005F87FBF|nr:patatin-like phospholipase family protein [Pseudofrankia sp. DC12]
MTIVSPTSRAGPVAFVIGGGGVLGAAEVGMLGALLEAGCRPDLIVGTSVGAINGAAVAADPTPTAIGRLTELWSDLGSSDVFAGGPAKRLATVVQHGYLHSNAPLRHLLQEHLAATFEELPVRFGCVAASIERAAARWFGAGQPDEAVPLVDAVLASCAVPALLPPVKIGDEHYVDGGLVESTPVGRAVALGARTVYVLHVGRIERPLRPGRWPWEAGLVAFEIARRRGFTDAVAALPAGVTVHVLPVGDGNAAPLLGLRYRSAAGVRRRIERAHEATAGYLERVTSGAPTDPPRGTEPAGPEGGVAAARGAHGNAGDATARPAGSGRRGGAR